MFKKFIPFCYFSNINIFKHNMAASKELKIRVRIVMVNVISDLNMDDILWITGNEIQREQLID